uniref:Uncharacterized protein n=1 Tax=Rhizochromulina marina TaxID=1034831 RepID=A0A7S2SRZ5_9STRA
MSPEAVLVAVQAEEGRTVVLESLDGLAVEGEMDGEGGDEHGLRVVAEDLGAEELAVREIPSSVTSLNLSGNALEGTGAVFLAPNHLRSLNLSGNPLGVSPDLGGCSLLVDLDVSFCPSITSGLAHLLSASLSSLRRLNLSGCEISSLVTDQEDQCVSLFTGVPHLLELSLADNVLDSMEAIAKGVSPLAQLHSIELRDNPVAEDTAYASKEFVAGLGLPALRRIDDKSLVFATEVRSLGEVAAAQGEERADVLIADAAASAAMEAEVDAALKGHKDNTAIA